MIFWLFPSAWISGTMDLWKNTMDLRKLVTRFGVRAAFNLKGRSIPRRARHQPWHLPPDTDTSLQVYMPTRLVTPTPSEQETSILDPDQL